jgi:hypothetical protein
MSEQWWFVMPFGEYVLPKVQHSESDAISFSLRRGGGRVVRGRIVEDAWPCDWERIILNNPNDVTPRTFGEYCRDECSHNYCPMCGRALRGDR